MTERSGPQIGRLTWALAGVSTMMILVLIAVSLLFTSRRAATSTMIPAVAEGDNLLVSRIDDTPELGDIVVWEDRSESARSGPFVHRVVGLGGDELESVDGILRRNGAMLDERYLELGTITTGLSPVTVPADMMFILGYRREVSLDSRRLGSVSVTATIGVVKATGPRWHLVLVMVSVAMTLITMISYLAGRARFVPGPVELEPPPAVFSDSLPDGPPLS